MKRANKILLIVFLVSSIALGIGYAAIQNINLKISGSAIATAADGSLKVKFSDTVSPVISDSTRIKTEKISDISQLINLNEVSQAEDSEYIIYTIENESAALSADLSVSTTNNNPEYITISSQLEKTSLSAGETTTVKVTITVNKTPIKEDIKAQIGVELIAMPVQPGEEGTSEGINDFSQTPMGINEYGFYFDRFYCNEVQGDGMIFHKNGSAEFFTLVKKEEHPDLTKDEWFCLDYARPGEINYEDIELDEITIEDDGKKLISSDGIEYTMSKIYPHGVYRNNRYWRGESYEGSKYCCILEDGTAVVQEFNDNGGLIADEFVECLLEPKANGYLIFLNGEILGTFSLTGELYYSQDDNTIYKLDEIHIYEQEIISEVTCITDGEVLYTCTDCDENYTLIIPAHNHKYDNDRNAICDDCGEKIEYIDVYLDSEYMWFLFGDVNSVTDIIIPEYIYEYASRSWVKLVGLDYGLFEDFSNLKSVVIPDTITSIGYGAFCYWDSLTTIYYTGTEEQWNEINIGENNEPLINATINFNYVIPAE